MEAAQNIPPPTPSPLSRFDLNALIARAKLLLTDPNAGWRAVETETTTEIDILKNYVVPLSGTAALVSAIITSSAGINFFAALTFQFIAFALGCAFLFVASFVLQKLAPKFEASVTAQHAFRLQAYAGTAAWVGGIAAIVPLIGWIAAILGGLYSIYLWYVGFTRLVHVPDTKKWPLIGAYIASMIGIALITSFILAPFLR